MGELRPYPEYKQTDLPWLESVPIHWSLIRNKLLFKPGKELVGEKSSEFTLLSLTLNGIIKRDMINPKGKFPAEFNSYQVVKENDFVFCLFDIDETPRTIGVSPYYGMITGAYSVFKPLVQNVKYLYYYYLSLDYAKGLKPVYTGLRKVIPEDRFLRIKTPFPPPNEQLQIARFLDWKTSQINKFIKAKKRQIELLKEQKQVIINDAVTGKIDVLTGKPYPKYKDSGVEWLGKVPKDWTIIRLKYIVRNINEQTNLKENDEFYIALENVESWTGRINIHSEEVAFESQVKRFKSGDILFGKLRPYLAKVVKSTFKGVCVGEFLVLRKFAPDVSIDFLAFKLRSYSVIHHINKSTFGAKMPRADWGFIGNMLFSTPVTYETQEAIAQYLNTRIISINKCIDKIEKEVILLREFQVRIICDIVTGKFDVRDIEIPQYVEEVEESNIDEDLVDKIDEVMMSEKECEDS